MKGLKHIMKRFETVMSAAAFAEEGEFTTARQILREGEGTDRRAANRPEVRKQPLRKTL